jgi:predicted nucleic-acid-binding Zn-ribbon protein
MEDHEEHYTRDDDKFGELICKYCHFRTFYTAKIVQYLTQRWENNFRCEPLKEF